VTLKKIYPVYCAWCEEKGRVTRVGWASVSHSHGICKECKREVLAEAREYIALKRIGKGTPLKICNGDGD